MRNVVLYMFTTLDSFIAGPHGEFLDYEPSDEEMAFANELFDSADGVLFGRATYEGFVSYWDALDPSVNPSARPTSSSPGSSAT